MCGLTALVSPHGDAALADIVAMTDVIRHRGPDSEGFVVFDESGVHRVAGPDTISFAGHGELPSAPTTDAADGLQGWAVLGHRRLSILDLTVTGHQPMTDHVGEQWLVFNGEVYNFVELRDRLRDLGHRFLGTGDTEVVLAAYREWGPAFLQHLVGMFALVIVDRPRRRLLAARDHFGVKPLYYWRLPTGAVAFASEIKAFGAVPEWAATVNGPRVYDFLNFGLHNHDTETMFDGVHQVGPGEYVEVDLAGGTADLRRHTWWQLRPEPFAGSFEEAAREFGARFRESVSWQLRSDVPVGSCLSGGLDSSSIVCTANDEFRESGDPFAQLAFTATSDDPAVDESRWVRLVAERTGVQVHSRTPQMASVPDLLPRLAWHLDEPFGSTSIVAQWTVFELAATHGIKVMLDGQGADEQLAGYTYFFAWRFQELLRAGRLGELARDVSATRRMHPGIMGGLARFTASLMLPERIAQWGGRLARVPTQDPDAWLDRAVLGVEGHPDPARQVGARQPSVRGLSLAQLTRSNLPRLLHYEDRDSMAHSVEARVPFLDHRLVELVVGLPSAYLIGAGTTKRVLREAMTGVLPEAIRTRRDKIGFQTAEERWMRHDDPARVMGLVRAAVDGSGGMLHHGTVARAQEILDGRRPFDDWVWRIISTGAWLEAHRVKV